MYKYTQYTTSASACWIGDGAHVNVCVPAAFSALNSAFCSDGTIIYPTRHPPALDHLENPVVVMVPSG